MQHNQIAHIIRYSVNSIQDLINIRCVSELFRIVADNYVHDMWERFATADHFCQAVKLNCLVYMEKLLTEKRLGVPRGLNVFDALKHCKTVEMSNFIQRIFKTSQNLHFMLAVRWGHPEIVQHYLSNGMSANMRVYHDAQEESCKIAYVTPISNTEEKVSIGDVSVDEHFKNLSIDLIHLAMYSGSFETVKLLEMGGARIREFPDDGYFRSDIIGSVMERGNMKLLRYLVSNGYTKRAYIYEEFDDEEGIRTYKRVVDEECLQSYDSSLFTEEQYEYLCRVSICDSVDMSPFPEINDHNPEDEQMFIDLKKNVEPSQFIELLVNFGNVAYYHLGRGLTLNRYGILASRPRAAKLFKK